MKESKTEDEAIGKLSKMVEIQKSTKVTPQVTPSNQSSDTEATPKVTNPTQSTTPSLLVTNPSPNPSQPSRDTPSDQKIPSDVEIVTLLETHPRRSDFWEAIQRDYGVTKGSSQAKKVMTIIRRYDDARAVTKAKSSTKQGVSLEESLGESSNQSSDTIGEVLNWFKKEYGG